MAYGNTSSIRKPIKAKKGALKAPSIKKRKIKK